MIQHSNSHFHTDTLTIIILIISHYNNYQIHTLTENHVGKFDPGVLIPHKFGYGVIESTVNVQVEGRP